MILSRPWMMMMWRWSVQYSQWLVITWRLCGDSSEGEVLSEGREIEREGGMEVC